MKKGDILKLSERGLEALYGFTPLRRERAQDYRFEYRGISESESNCIKVVKLGIKTRSTHLYFHAFMELA